jgi:transposase
MANQLKVGWVHTIEALLERGWSHRRIAEALGIDRGTVARYARLASQSRCRSELEAKAAGAPPGSEGGGAGDSDALSDSNPARAPLGSIANSAADSSVPGDSIAGGAPSGSTGPDAPTAPASETPPRPPVQPSRCEPFREIILAKLQQGLSGQRIYQDLVGEHGFAARYHSVRRFVRHLGQASPLPFRRMECAPGEQAQVDFGKGAPVIQPNGKRKRPHVLRVILSHSRKGYSEALWRQDTESFIRGLENAFHHFGGVPKTLVPDNLKAAVIQADWFDPDLNPKIQSFCEHYQTTMLPTRPRTPRHKGKVERGVGYVQENGLKGLEFPSLP